MHKCSVLSFTHIDRFSSLNIQMTGMISFTPDIVRPIPARVNPGTNFWIFKGIPRKHRQRVPGFHRDQ